MSSFNIVGLDRLINDVDLENKKVISLHKDVFLIENIILRLEEIRRKFMSLSYHNDDDKSKSNLYLDISFCFKEIANDLSELKKV